jgi:hypothetical protein
MNKKAWITAALLLSLVLLIGCGNSGAPGGETTVPPPEQTETPAATPPPAVELTPDPAEPTPGAGEGEAPLEGTDEGSLPGIGEALKDLVLDEYEGLTLFAETPEDMAVAPGEAVPVTVSVENNGDRSVYYVQGSGSYTIPDALLFEAEGLQPVLPKDRLGISTADYHVKELKAGESVSFTVHVFTTVPNTQFENYTRELFDADGSYIADLDYSALHEKYADIAMADIGSYFGNVFFRYAAGEADSPNAVTMEPTAYAQAAFAINLS